MNSEPDDGGPAFPQTIEMAPGRSRAYWGMSLRDYFAAQALYTSIIWKGTPEVTEQSIAAQAYKLADAMLSAREQKPCACSETQSG